MPSSLAPLVTAFNVWWISGLLSVAWSALGVREAALPARGAAAVFGALVSLVSWAAMTVVARQAWSPHSMFGAVAIYVVGIPFSLAMALCYAFFFMFWHTKDF